MGDFLLMNHSTIIRPTKCVKDKHAVASHLDEHNCVGCCRDYFYNILNSHFWNLCATECLYFVCFSFVDRQKLKWSKESNSD